jgi:hypothetical protein
VGLVIPALPRFDGLPEEIDAHRIEPGGGHRLEGTLERLRADPPGPVGALDGDEVRTHRQNRPTVSPQVVGSPNDSLVVDEAS